MIDNPFVFAVLIIAATMVTAFVASLLKDDYSVIDIFWPIGILLVALFLVEDTQTLNERLIKLFVTIWAARLSSYLLHRNLSKGPDKRYQDLRKDWGAKDRTKALVYIFLPQTVLMFLISLPIITSQHIESQNNMSLAIGSTLWLVGFLLETIADFRLYKFKQNPKNEGSYLNTGLFKISRHPNYLGEAILWIGISILALPNSLFLLPLLGPAILIFCLYKFTGVPYAERNRKGREFEDYVRTTGAIFPKLF